MKAIVENSKYLVLIAVITSLVVALAAFGWGVAKAIGAVTTTVTSNGKDPLISGSFIELMDAFLIAVALYIFSVALYELFIADLNLPGWLVINTLDELKDC